MPESEKQKKYKELQKKQEISKAQYVDILFNMVVNRRDFARVENISDFVDLVESKFKRVVDIDQKDSVQILFVEKIDSQFNFIIHTKEKSIFDLQDKELLVFLIEKPEARIKEMVVQTDNHPTFYYQFDSQQPKRLPNDCELCNKPIEITEEFIRLLDCNHLYHRICLIHRIVELTSKRFFLTRKEQLQL